MLDCLGLATCFALTKWRPIPLPTKTKSTSEQRRVLLNNNKDATFSREVLAFTSTPTNGSTLNSGELQVGSSEEGRFFGRAIRPMRG